MNNITRTAADHSAGVRPGGYKIHGSLTWTFHTLLASTESASSTDKFYSQHSTSEWCRLIKYRQVDPNFQFDTIYIR